MPNKSNVFFFTLLCLNLAVYPYTSAAYASFEDLLVGAKLNALAGAYVAMANDPEAIFSNPSGLTQLNSIGSALFYSRPYGIQELTHGGLAAIWPFSQHSIGVGVQTFGNEIYKENTLITALAHRFHRNLSLGVSFRYHHLYIAKYGSSSAFAFDVGMILHLNPKWQFGFCTKNINRSKISKTEEVLPEIFLTGWSVQILNKFWLNGELYKDVRFPLDFRCGIEAQALKMLKTRVGFSTNPARIAAGFGLVFGNFRWDYAFHHHPDLGFTHHVSISFSLNS